MTNNNLRWDTSKIYENIKSKKIEDDLTILKNNIESFKKKYIKKINNSCTEDFFLESIIDYQKIYTKMNKISGYSYLQYSTNMNNDQYLSFFSNISNKMNSFSSELKFYTIDINKVSKQTIELFFKHKDIQPYKEFIKNIRNFKKYQLSEEIEVLFTKKAQTSNSNWIKIYDQILNNIDFPINNKIYKINNVTDLFYSENREIRKEAHLVFSSELKKKEQFFTTIYDTIVQDEKIELEYRNIKRPISLRNIGNNIDDKIVDNLIEISSENYQNICHRFYKLKAKVTGVEKVAYFDRNFVPEKLGKYEWKKAVDLVLDCYKNFSTELYEIAKKFIDNKWIDIESYDGKMSGAYAHPMSCDTNPFLFLNYNGKLRDIFTFAHELGHGIHQYLSKQLGDINANTPLTLAETASIFSERLLLDHLINNSSFNDEEKDYILVNFLNDTMSTLFRQISFVKFEIELHNIGQKESLSSEKIKEIWIKTQTESLGNYVDFDKNAENYWMYISHFYHVPFYVYSYAFGKLLSEGIYSYYIKNKKSPEFVNKYINVLKAGGSRDTSELLKNELSINIKGKKFWIDSIKSIDLILNKYEKQLKI